MGHKTLLHADLDGFKVFKKGKVREIYVLEHNKTLLMVATDRISAYDSVLPQGIPRKGEILTQLSVYWFKKTSGIASNHLLEHRFDSFPEQLKPYKDILAERSIIVKHTKPYPVECIVRGYITGSGWIEYQETGSICSIKLPKNLRESEKLPEPIFTPSTKAVSGHDINISFEETIKILGENIVLKLRETSLKLYEHVSKLAEKQGIIIADTKFEYGEFEGEPILIDEIFTPDSSRFWETDKYKPGYPQKSLDKQFVRDYLNSVNWDRTPPAPDLPEDIINTTSNKYLDVYKKLTGLEIS